MKKRLRAIIDAILGRYEAVQYSPNRSWIHSALQHARLDLSKSTREELCRLALWFECNSEIVQKFLDVWECYTVGAGLQITPNSSSPEWNMRAKKWHTQWERYPDINSRQNFSTFMSLGSRAWFLQGEVFLMFVEGAAVGRPPYPRLQMIEGRLCMTPEDMTDQEGSTIIDGVRIDERGRPIGYYLAQEDSKGRKTFGAPKPAESIIHWFEPSRPGESRGKTYLHAGMNGLRDLDDLHVLEMIACKDAASISNVYKTGTGELNAAELIRSRGQVRQQGGTANSADSLEDRAAHVSEALGGRSVAIRQGEEVEQYRSERPSVTTREYWKYKTELACNAVGIPYCMVFPDVMQGTVYRGALDMAATFFQQRFCVVSDVCRRIYERNMNWARFNEPTLRDAPGDWANVIIHAPRAPNVDVGYNSAAALAELKVGACNFSQIYGPRGLDWREQFDALKEQLEYAKKIGLTELLGEMTAAEMAKPSPSDQADSIPIQQPGGQYAD